MGNFLKTFAREHPSLLLTACYFFVTIIGVVYSYFFYREFAINIIKFADLSDFLLASLLEPISIIIFIAVVVLSVLTYLLELRLRQRYKGWGNWTANKQRAKYTDPIVIALAVIFLVGMYVRNFAIANALEVKMGEVDEYRVRFIDAGGEAVERPLALLGNSSRFSFFYDPASTETLVVPSENIAFMRKQAQSGSVQE